MHGQYIRNIDRQLIIEEETFLWLSKGDLKAETESEIVAAKDQRYKQNTKQQKYWKQKQIANQTLPTIWWDNRPHNIGMPYTGKRTVHKKTW